ncbi:MAG: leucyl aminopeptidase family protein [Bdellovibrionales bacterium]|nr:leucyl aminopeptidase family protein [Bdellovibrionales bacterium]
MAENCHLILAVGQGANHKPCLVHLSYRPSCLQNSLGVEESKVKAREQKNFKKASPTPDNKLQYKTQDKPQYKKVAFVGKGITFDSGGLDLKPSSGMRWMKKDMGGSAALVGLAWWVAQTQPEFCCDFYLPLAENAVSQNSFRPGDVYDSKVGLKVEIHNTDAEGRLVLADAMTVALQDKPDLLIDVATLTGAIKAGLGSGIAGLFGNRDLWIAQMLESSQKRGDWMWPMPLFQSYQTALKSQFADLVNASEGFGGAITAALFLQQFVQNCPWLHLDIYAWKDGVEGPLLESGANGQPVQALIHFLNHFNSCSPIK